MKKIILFGLMIFGLAACKKTKNEPDQRPDDRLTAALTGYQNQLAEAGNGWIAYLFPKGGGVYTFKFKFDKSNRVTMYSDLDAKKASVAKESSYRLRAVQMPNLYFDTFNYLHIIADPDPQISGGAEGEGRSSDFEFSFLSSSPDTIKLQGNLNSSSMILVRAKPEEGDDYIAKVYENNQSLARLKNFHYYYNKITIGGKEYNITINTDQHTVSFYYDNGGFKRFTTEYASTANGMLLRSPFIDGNTVVTEFHDISINPATGTADLYSGTVKLAINNVPAALVLDKGAATQMYTTPYSYTSNLGFTINGITNAHAVTSIEGFKNMKFVVNAFVDPFDAVWFYYSNTRFGPIFNTRLDADGKMVFIKSPYGSQGDIPSFTAYIIASLFENQWTDATGYYVFQTGVHSYDLISVKDSRIWIRFY